MKQLERYEQTQVFNWAKWKIEKYPELMVMYAIPNGGSRNVIEAKYLKASGVRAGIPDICLPVPRHGYGALYIEMKSKNGKVSGIQKDIFGKLSLFYNKVVVCYSANEAIKAIEAYLRPPSK